MEINDNEIRTVEEVLLPKECSFGEDAIRVIKCWESAEVLACPGSGKTTVLLAKLKILSDKMPIEAGRGICVLSHTNVAVNEIKEKLGESAQKILGFPNYVGTLQTFVDRYITFPYLKQIVKAPIQVVDRKEYAIALHSLINVRYKKLASFLRLQYKNTYSSIYADIIVRKLLCKICYILGKKNENPQYGAKEFNLSSMKKYLENEHGSTYKSSIIHLTELSCFDYDAVEAQIKSIIRLLFDDKSISEIPESFMKYGQDDNGNTSKDNRYKENEICIQFDTVFGVKGETHDATLYLETESRRGTDFKRIMPLLEGKKLKSTSAICEKSRRCVYVGFSRPKYLLCVAMCISTYQNHEKAFEDWKVIDLTQIK